MLGKTRSFNDIYSQIFNVTEDLLAGRLDAHRAMAFAANMKVMNEIITTEIKIHQMEMENHKSIPVLGGRVISTDDAAGNTLDVALDVEPAVDVCRDSVRQIADTRIVSSKARSRTRKPRIGVVGLLPSQNGEIASDFGALSDITFWDTGSGQKQLAALSGCDVVFLHTAHSSHSTNEALNSAGANVIRVGGGVSAMKLAIKKHFDGVSAATAR